MAIMFIYNAIKPLLPEGLVHPNEPMSRHTSFKIGGPAEVYVTPENADQASAVWLACLNNDYPITILGDGCNVLVSDEGIKGVVIATSRMNKIEISGTTISAGSGTKMARLAEEACKAGLKGLEFASGIPGTIGGGVYMNAGAYGHDINDVCKSVEALLPDGTVKEYTHMGFDYRTSRFQSEKSIITKAAFNLAPAPQEEIRAEMTKLNTKRRASQPLDYPSAGSTFKRPAIKDKYASRLIDECGLKGFTIGGAQVSEKHAGFVVNKGNATAKDVLALMAAVQEKVYEQTEILLTPEVQLLGW